MTNETYQSETKMAIKQENPTFFVVFHSSREAAARQREGLLCFILQNESVELVLDREEQNRFTVFQKECWTTEKLANEPTITTSNKSNK